MTTVSTHVLDAATGRPAVAVPVVLERDVAQVAAGTTDADGRIKDVAADLAPGVYRLRFDIAAYQGPEAFYPEVVLTFRIRADDDHLHVPLLLSPYSYSTYRGS